MTRQGRRPACYVQVNTGEEPQKAGVLPAEADAFVEACRTVHGLPLAGLMCIPPVDDDTALHFALLREKSEEHTSELQSLMRISYAVFCLKKKNSLSTLP